MGRQIGEGRDCKPQTSQEAFAKFYTEVMEETAVTEMEVTGSGNWTGREKSGEEVVREWQSLEQERSYIIVREKDFSDIVASFDMEHIHTYGEGKRLPYLRKNI